MEDNPLWARRKYEPIARRRGKRKRRMLLPATILHLSYPLCNGAAIPQNNAEQSLQPRILLEEKFIIASTSELKKGPIARREIGSNKDKAERAELFEHTPVHSDEKKEKDRQWESIQADWNANWKATPIDPNSRDSKVHLEKGKERAGTTPFTFSEHTSDTSGATFASSNEKKKSNRKARNQQSLKWTQQKSPFHSSEVGSSSKSPQNIGLFRPEYPFIPSGRRRKLANGNLYLLDKEGLESSLLNSAYNQRHSPSVIHSNVMKYGWTEAILDDDARLSVPDEWRRARESTLLTKELFGKKWFRWKPGEGYVYSRTKDFSVYRFGPGVALAHLLPPREKPVLSSLPMIPNDSKRDFVWLIISSIFFFAFLAMVKEIRSQWRSSRKGKKRIPSLLNGTSRNSMEMATTRGANGAISLTASSTLPHALTTRRRSQGQSFRDLYNFAFRRGRGYDNTKDSKIQRSFQPRRLSRVVITNDAFSSGREVARTTRRSTGPQAYGSESESTRFHSMNHGSMDGSRSADSTMINSQRLRLSNKQPVLTSISISSEK